MTIPILLVPGLNCTAEVFAAQLPSLWARGPVTIANHLAGGKTVAGIAAAILEAAPPRFALLGFSMGGYIAFEILRQAPDRILRLALLDTSARPDSPESREKRLAAIALTEQGKFNLAVSQTFPNVVHPDHVGDARLRALHVGMALAVGPETYIRHQQAIMARPDSRPDLPGIGQPTTVIVGAADTVTPPEHAAEMASAIPGARLVTLPDAGHLTPIEQPGLLTAALLEWLA